MECRRDSPANFIFVKYSLYFTTDIWSVETKHGVSNEYQQLNENQIIQLPGCTSRHQPDTLIPMIFWAGDSSAWDIASGKVLYFGNQAGKRIDRHERVRCTAGNGRAGRFLLLHCATHMDVGSAGFAGANTGHFRLSSSASCSARKPRACIPACPFAALGAHPWRSDARPGFSGLAG
jgi:hypothetical protein